MADERDRIYFPPDEYTLAIMRAGGEDRSISIRDVDGGYRNNPQARLELLAWAQLKATRQQAESLGKLAAAINQMALGAHDQAQAVREQTAKMQANIDDARASAVEPEDLLRRVLDIAPEVMAKIGQSGNGLGDLVAQLTGGAGIQKARGGQPT